MKTSATFLLLAALVLAVPSAQAGLTYLPDGYLDGWGNRANFGVNLGDGQFVIGHIEFAVYDTQAVGDLGFSSPGDRQYVYAYQIFSETATTFLDYFALTGIPSSAIQSNDDIGTDDVYGGVAAERFGFNLTRTKAFFEFEDGLLVEGENSVLLLLGSDGAPIVGGYEFTPSADPEVPVPEIPEPATLALLLGGSLLAFRRRS